MTAEGTPHEGPGTDDVSKAAVRYWRTRTYLAYARFGLWVLWIVIGVGDIPPGDPLL
ncbi:hypothetical protein Ppa06_67420 [Planomonospora parontospora subsp. parontospora]|uniref:Uncharacterized protein n=2 Tax=Planomonospora parontospora TaxID=58119 RepID=A0AA37F888_9ACTN|nr:hypothetical protein GCM10010126_68620 [Planomonospora parontospora]GII12944.1 hypothetical protein Ppa06_67420 [Planomonospora parontospora subsp. parontospora]